MGSGKTVRREVPRRQSRPSSAMLRREAREGAGDENFAVQKFWFKEQQQLEGKGGQHSNAEPPPPAATDSKRDSCGTVIMW